MIKFTTPSASIKGFGNETLILNLGNGARVEVGKLRNLFITKYLFPWVMINHYFTSLLTLLGYSDNRMEML